MRSVYRLVFIILILKVNFYLTKESKNVVVDNVYDIKDFKKVIRTKTNVLVCFTNSMKQTAQVIKVFREAADVIKGQGTMVLIDCSGDSKKICKKLKINPDPFILKHYKNGEFNRDYDRRNSVSSMVNFMRDPTGDLPWEEDATANDVVHIPDAENLAKFIRQESKPLMVMFYAPWCGFCKTLKPEYVAAAKDLKNHSVLAAIDVNKPENAVIRTLYNITGFPTLLFYKNGVMKYQYEGDNKRQAIVSFMKNPSKPVKIKEQEWSEVDSEVVHLTATNFDPVVKEEASLLVMFYAPWCGHCKKIKPEYEKAAAKLKADGIPGMMAAVDATKEVTIADRFSVKGYPTIKYFSYGEHKFDINLREASKIVEFMRSPKEPPPPPPPEKPWSEEESQVVHLTDDNFKSFLKKKRHVLVIFYAPWCGHCKKAKPEFTRAADYFKDDPKVEFAAVDCTTHQSLCAANEVSGYPTIRYFSYLNKNTKAYNSGRAAEDFIAFMTDPDKPLSSSTQQNLPSAVSHLTDSTFEHEISTKQVVLVMFHAP
ncbi:protein disulfide-isomerase A5, partial [Asbolus verrucosus]